MNRLTNWYHARRAHQAVDQLPAHTISRVAAFWGRVFGYGVMLGVLALWGPPAVFITAGLATVRYFLFDYWDRRH